MARLIAFEGIDKSGKATQSRILAERLGCKRIAFPRYETELGDAIKKHLTGSIMVAREHVIDSCLYIVDGNSYWTRAPVDALVFQCMMLTDKVHALKEISEESVLVLDRWKHSAIAYGTADGLDPVWLETVSSVLPEPAITFLLDIDPEVAMTRGRAVGDSRDTDRYEADLTKMRTVREIYARLFLDAGPYAGGNLRIILDAAEPVDSVARNVQRWVDRK
jgi:dTMP kinase